MIPQIKGAGKQHLEGGVTKPVMLVFALLSLSIIGIEFIFDLKRNLFWYRAIIICDFSLIAAYFSLIVAKALSARRHIFELVYNHKADVVYLIIIGVFLFVPRLAAALIIVRFSLSLSARFLETPPGKKLVNAVNLRPSQTLALSFLGFLE